MAICLYVVCRADICFWISGYYYNIHFGVDTQIHVQHIHCVDEI